jgi:hypothetical protein
MFKKISLFTAVALLPLATANADDPAVDAAACAAESCATEMAVATDISPVRNPLSDLKELEKFALKKPLIELPAPDPARLAIAEQIIGKLMPDGTYKRTMEAVDADLVRPLLNRFWPMKGSEFAEAFGITDMKERDRNETFGEAISRDDPYAKERAEAYIKAYIDIVGDIVSPIEGDIRGAMARDYARKYDAKMLNDMNGFLSTPTGAIFARDYMLSGFTLDVLQTTLMVWPKMMKNADQFEQRWKDATAHLPPVPKKDYGTACEPGDTVCEEAQLHSAELGDEPWYDAENWTAAERTKVDALREAYQKIADQQSLMYESLRAAEDEATDKARKKFKAAGWKPEPATE